jgi:hypothetical protein
VGLRCSGDALAMTLVIDDNFAINAEVGNSKDANFWLVCCTKPFHQIKRTFMNKWGISFVARYAIMSSLYYQMWGHNESSYVLLKDSHVVYLHVHLVQDVKFLMPPKDHMVSGNEGCMN